MSKKIVLAIVVALVVGFIVGNLLLSGDQAPAPEPTQDQNVQTGNITNIVDEYINGVKIGNVGHMGANIVLERGEQFKAWRNTTGKTLYVSNATILTFADPLNSASTGSASSTMFLFAGTSTASTLTTGLGLASYGRTNEYYASGTDPAVIDNLPFGGIFDNLFLATNTVATSTNWHDAGNRRSNRDSSSGSVRVANNEWVYFFLTTGSNESPEGDLGDICAPTDETANVCEYATSTVRGFNARLLLEFVYN